MVSRNEHFPSLRWFWLQYSVFVFVFVLNHSNRNSSLRILSLDNVPLLTDRHFGILLALAPKAMQSHDFLYSFLEFLPLISCAPLLLIMVHILRSLCLGFFFLAQSNAMPNAVVLLPTTKEGSETKCKMISGLVLYILACLPQFPYPPNFCLRYCCLPQVKDIANHRNRQLCVNSLGPDC